MRTKKKKWKVERFKKEHITTCGFKGKILDPMPHLLRRATIFATLFKLYFGKVFEKNHFKLLGYVFQTGREFLSPLFKHQASVQNNLPKHLSLGGEIHVFLALPPNKCFCMSHLL